MLHRVAIASLLFLAAPYMRGDSWSGWNSLGGGIVGAPTAVVNVDGRLEIFALGGNTVYHNWQTSPAGGWSGWMSLGGSLKAAPAAVTNADGRLELFGVGTDGALWHAWQRAAANSQSYTGWASLGGGIYAQPAAAANSDGRLEVVVLGGGHTVYHIWQLTPGGGWSSFASLGGSIASAPYISTNLDGRLEILAQGTDNGLWHAWEQAAGNSSSYTGWGSLGAPAGAVTSAPSAATNADGRIEAFVRGADGAAWHIWQTSAGGGWTGWYTLGGGIIGMPIATINADGRLEVFVVGGGNAIYHNWQVTAGGGWSGWVSLGGVLLAPPGVTMNANGTLEIFSQGTDSAAWHDWQTVAGGGDGPSGPTSTPITPPVIPPPVNVGGLYYAGLDSTNIFPETVFAPSSTYTVYAYCYNPDNELELIPCNISLATNYYIGTNGHFHTNPPAPVSSISPTSGYTGDYPDLEIPVTLQTTRVGQIEAIYVEDLDDGWVYHTDYGVGYNTFTYVNSSNIFIQIGGNTTMHGDNTWNHWMTPSALAGLQNATTAYLNANNPGGSVCINDMSLPIGGVFDISATSRWGPPHVSHDKGTAADIATVASQCPAPDVVLPGAFMKACATNGAVDWRVEIPPHVHCRWPQ